LLFLFSSCPFKAAWLVFCNVMIRENRFFLVPCCILPFFLNLPVPPPPGVTFTNSYPGSRDSARPPCCLCIVQIPLTTALFAPRGSSDLSPFSAAHPLIAVAPHPPTLISRSFSSPFPPLTPPPFCVPHFLFFLNLRVPRFFFYSLRLHLTSCSCEVSLSVAMGPFLPFSRVTGS